MVLTSYPEIALAAGPDEPENAIVEEVVESEEEVAETSDPVEAVAAVDETVEENTDAVEADNATIELPHELRVYKGSTNLLYTAETTAKDGGRTNFTLKTAENDTGRI